MTRNTDRRSPLAGVVALIVFTICACLLGTNLVSLAWAAKTKAGQTGKEDDWRFEEEYAKVNKGRSPGNGPLAGGGAGSLLKSVAPSPVMPAMPSTMAAAPAARVGEIGLSAGGAKDIANFRENIAKGLLPLPTDVTSEGLFYDYYFATGGSCGEGELFCPTYTMAVSDEPFTKKPEYYLSVGLGSGIKAADFRRKTLNLMLVLDISGSMSAPFDTYSYDRFKGQAEAAEQEGDRRMAKIDAAKEALIALLDHLNPDDRFGLVLFDQYAYTALVPRPVARRDMAAIKGHIRDLRPMGGTNLDAGLAQATSLMQGARDSDPETFENRIVFMTDAMPNLGSTSDAAFLARLRDNAAIRLYSTVIGIGLDFNTALVEKITKARGANYYSVHSPGEFRKRLDAEFDDMVTPLVFDLALRVTSSGYKIDTVFGSPEADAATGEIMRVNTLFPSPTTEAGTRGGLILLRLTRTGDSPAISLTANYEDRAGKRHAIIRQLDFRPSGQAYGSVSIRKGILLARYAALLREWLTAAQGDKPGHTPPPEPMVAGRPGTPQTLGQWERQSRTLLVSPEQRARFATFLAYFRQEMPDCQDAGLARELKVLDTLTTPHPGG
jgi:Ca-activated chloride channel family protein